MLKRIWADYIRYPISNTCALAIFGLSFSAAQERVSYLLLAYLIFLSPHIVRSELE